MTDKLPNSSTARVCKFDHTITDNDILFGRGSGANDHRGNITFRHIVSTRRSEYLVAPARTDKARIANEILDVVKNLNPPGRFLEKVEGDEGSKDKNSDAKWTVVSDHKAAEKVKQALRQMQRRKRESSTLDYNGNYDTLNDRCIYKKAKGAHHTPPCLPGNAYSEASHQSQYYHYPANHCIVHNNDVVPATDTKSYDFNGTSVCHSHTPPSSTPESTISPTSTPPPPPIPSCASSVKSEAHANADLKNFSVELDKATFLNSHDQQDKNLRQLAWELLKISGRTISAGQQIRAKLKLPKSQRLF